MPWLLRRLRAGGLLVAFALAMPAPVSAQRLDPQVLGLQRLRAASSTALQPRFYRGFPRFVRMNVAAPGTDPVNAARAFLASNADFYGIGAPPDPRLPALRTTELVLANLEARALGGFAEVVRFGETYDGLPVFGSSLVVSLQQPPTGGPRRVVASAGALLGTQRDPIDVVPRVSAARAEEVARAHVGAPPGPVESPTFLAIYAPVLFRQDGPPRLAHVVELGPNEVLVDAHDESILLAQPFSYEDYPDRDIDLENAEGFEAVATNCFTFSNGLVGDYSEEIGSEEGLYPGWTQDANAIVAFEEGKHTLDWYYDRFGQRSVDDDDAPLELFVHSGIGNNASYVWNCGIQFGPNWISNDTVTHETTHEVIDNSSDLVYSFQSGALNESYADTMAAFADGDDDWVHGEEKLNGFGAQRSLRDPSGPDCGSQANNFCGQPDKLSSFVFVSGNTDNGGVHTNSGIPNKAHFLVSEGGTFNGRTVAAIGNTRAQRLFFAVMKSHAPGAGFSDDRDLAVTIAQIFDDFGWAGFEPQHVCSVKNAYAAVEIGRGDLDCDGIEDAFDDSDNDSIADDEDNCTTVPNPSQQDADDDGVGDACQDSDGDGISDAVDNCPTVANAGGYDTDDDGLGDACDTDDDNDGFFDTNDNCPYDANPTQFDGNQNGEGDACDPDQDGDGLYVEADNCTFVFNPLQQDQDGDGLGDACDGCPAVANNQNAYTNPPCIQGPSGEICPDPEPLQTDSDGDGTPDACDAVGFGSHAFDLDGSPFNPAIGVKPDGARKSGRIQGPAGAKVKLPLPICHDGDRAPDDDDRFELRFTNLHASVLPRVVNERGGRGPAAEGSGPIRGLRMKPDCRHHYFLVFELGPDFPGDTGFEIVARDILSTGPNPWVLGPPIQGSVPESLPDGDGDGLYDSVDSCPAASDPWNVDRDADGAGDACDNCALASNPTQRDGGGVGLASGPDGIGDACQCGDVNDDGRVTGLDGALVKRAALGLAPFPGGVGDLPAPRKCDVGGTAGCTGLDGTIMTRASLGLKPAIAQACPAATGAP